MHNAAIMNVIGSNRDFHDRWRLAQKEGISLWQIMIDDKTLEIIKNGRIPARTFEGEACIEDIIDTPEIIYDRGDLYKQENLERVNRIRFELVNQGKKFINEPKFLFLSADKLRSADYFKENEINTPETHQLDENILEYMVDKYKLVFVKPRFGSFGDRITSIEMIREDLYELRLGFNREKINKKRIFERIKNYENNIIQEGIKCPRISGRVFDIRVVYQKDDTEILRRTCSYVRVGARGRNISNIDKGGKPEITEIIQLIFHNSRILENVYELTNYATRKIEKDFIVAEVAWDVIIRGEEALILEVNSKPFFEGAKTLARFKKESVYKEFVYDNTIRRAWGETYERLLRNPFKYARQIFKPHVQITDLSLEATL